MIISKVEESLSGVGGYVVYSDNRLSPYHVFEGMRKTPIALATKQALSEWLKDNTPVSSDVIKKQLEVAQMQAESESEKRAKLRKEAEAKKEAELIIRIAEEYGLTKPK